MLSLDGIVEFSESARPAIPTHKHAQRIEEVVGVLAMMTAVVIVHGGANVITTSVAIIATKMFASSDSQYILDGKYFRNDFGTAFCAILNNSNTILGTASN